MAGLKWFWRLFLSSVWQRLQFRPPFNPSATSKGERKLQSFTAVVTGGSAGIGFETALYLASQGASVIITSRSKGRGDAALEALKRSSAATLDVRCLQLDLADLKSVASFATEVKHAFGSRHLDLLVCNAGILDVPYQTSPQGHEITFASNHLGHFLLTKKLLPLLRKPGGRVVVVSGELHTLAADVTPDYKSSGQDAYIRSKLANVWFAYELQRREPDITVPVLHPGVIATSMAPSGIFFSIFKNLIFIPVDKGAWTTLYCCLSPDARGHTYYHNCLGIVPSSPLSYDIKKARQFWDLSEKLVTDF